MQRLAQALVRRSVAWAVVLTVGALAVAAGLYASRVQQDDDLLAFLPRGDADVRAFHDINRRFGATDVAIVGIETPDVFAGDFLARLKTATARLNATEGVGFALSLTNLESFGADAEHGGIRTDYLVGEPPVTPERRARVLAEDTARDLVSPDGRAVVIYAFGAHGGDPRQLALRVRGVVEDVFPRETKHWGGAPFISTYIFDLTQRDLRRLAPWAVAVKVAITIISFRSLVGTALALLSPALGIVMALGLMGALGVHSNIVIGSMPIILFALGSAYAIHFLARYYLLVGEHGVEEAVRRALVALGPLIIATGLAIVGGLLSFVVMDIAPMRTFGLFTAIGLAASLVLSLTFVPAVVVLLRAREPTTARASGRVGEALGALVGAAVRHRVALGFGLAAVALVAVPLALAVDSRVDNAAFYAKDSPPARAERFLSERFGGSLFLQLEVAGDLTSPTVLRRAGELADRVAALPGVTSVASIADVLALLDEALSGDRILPDTPAKARLLYGFLEGKRAVRQLVDDERRHALIQVKLASARPEDSARVLAAVRALVAAPPGDAVLARIGAILAREGQPVPASLPGKLAAGPPPAPPERVRATVEAYLGSDEFMGDLPAGMDRAQVAAAVAAAGPGGDLAAALGPELAGDLARPVAEIWRRERAQAWARALGLPLPEARLTAVGHALLDRDGPAPSGELTVAVSGLPVLHQGLSRSVARNQVQSMAFAFVFVLIITTLLYRSVAAGLVAAAPALFTVAVLYAGMRLGGIRLDIGTSVLASLTIGAGVDYAIHLLAAWSAEPPAAAARTSGQGIWTNALMIAAGFLVLTFGEARPLQIVGGLTAAAMVLSALATFLIIPVLRPVIRRTRYP